MHEETRIAMQPLHGGPINVEQAEAQLAEARKRQKAARKERKRQKRIQRGRRRARELAIQTFAEVARNSSDPKARIKAAVELHERASSLDRTVAVPR